MDQNLWEILENAIETHPKLFLEADDNSKPAHLNMLRDTFAVERLLAGMPLEEVSRLLGHSSVLITRKHYAPWVLESVAEACDECADRRVHNGSERRCPFVNIADGRSGRVARRAACS